MKCTQYTSTSIRALPALTFTQLCTGKVAGLPETSNSFVPLRLPAATSTAVLAWTVKSHIPAEGEFCFLPLLLLLLLCCCCCCCCCCYCCAAVTRAQAVTNTTYMAGKRQAVRSAQKAAWPSACICPCCGARVSSFGCIESFSCSSASGTVPLPRCCSDWHPILCHGARPGKQAKASFHT